MDTIHARNIRVPSRVVARLAIGTALALLAAPPLVVSCGPSAFSVPVTGVSFSIPVGMQIHVGETLQLVAAVTPSDASCKDVSWSSLDPSRVEISPTGLLRAWGPGVNRVFATTVDGRFMASAEITILPRNWNINPLSTLNGGNTLVNPRLAISADGTKLVVSKQYSGAAVPTVFRSSDGGATWNDSHVTTEAWITDIAGTPDLGKLVFAQDGAALDLLVSNDGAITLLNESPALPLHRAGCAIASDASFLLTGGGAASTIGYIQTRSGATWSTSVTPEPASPTKDWRGFAIPTGSSSLAYAVAQDDSRLWVFNRQNVLWSSISTPGGQWTGVATSSDGSTIVLIGSMTMYPYLLTRDRYATWQPVIASGPFRSVAVSADGRVIVLGRSTGPLCVSLDGGKHFEDIPLSQNWADVAVSADGSVIYAAADGDYVYRITP